MIIKLGGNIASRIISCYFIEDVDSWKLKARVMKSAHIAVVRRSM